MKDQPVDKLKAIAAVYEYTGKQAGAVYCVGQGGDQGTRALVNNLKGGTFTNPEHTEYTWGSEENIAALKADSSSKLRPFPLRGGAFVHVKLLCRTGDCPCP